MAPLSPKELSRLVSQVVPRILRGVRLDLFARGGVTQSQFLVVTALHGRGACRMSDLARGLHVSMPTATGLVDRLYRSGHAKRGAGPKDRRQVVVTLTRKGEDVVQRFQDSVARRWEEMFQGFSAIELEAFRAVFLKLAERLKAEE